MSTVASIAVEAVPTIRMSIHIRDDLRAEIQITGPTNQMVTLESAPSITGPWQQNASATLTTNRITIVERNQIGTTPLFFRAR
jgi:hypothetical protein